MTYNEITKELEKIDEIVKDIPLCLMDEGFVTRCNEVAPDKTILIEKHKGYIVEYVGEYPNIEEKIIRELTKEEYEKVIEKYVEKREYFEFLKKEYQKAVKTAKEMKCEVYFDNLELMHLAELSEYFGEDGFAQS